MSGPDLSAYDHVEFTHGGTAVEGELTCDSLHPVLDQFRRKLRPPATPPMHP